MQDRETGEDISRDLTDRRAQSMAANRLPISFSSKIGARIKSV